MVTAEHKTNRYGSRYLYYHCTKRMLGPRCPEQSIEVGELEQQMLVFLKGLAVHPLIQPWIVQLLALSEADRLAADDARRTSLQRALRTVETELRELTGLRTRLLIEDAEFMADRQRLHSEAVRLRMKLEEDRSGLDRFEPAQELISFSLQAADWFSHGNDEDKRLIIQTVGSNPTLRGKILSIGAAKPFIDIRDLVACLPVRGVRDDVRTGRRVQSIATRHCRSINQLLRTEQFAKVIPTILKLKERFQPPERREAA